MMSVYSLFFVRKAGQPEVGTTHGAHFQFGCPESAWLTLVSYGPNEKRVIGHDQRHYTNDQARDTLLRDLDISSLRRAEVNKDISRT